MAKVLDPLHSAAARGKVGALVFNQTGSINYVKGLTSPANQRTTRQLAIRARLTTSSRAWAALTPAQRASWADYAVLHPLTDWTGKSYTLSGFNYYCMLNTRLTDHGYSAITDPPTDPAPSAPGTVVATGGAGSCGITWTALAGTSLQFEVWMQGPHSEGLTGKIERATYKSKANGEAGTITISSLSAGFYTFFVRALDETSGLVSSWQSVTATVT